MERSAELGAYFLTLLQTLRSSDLKEVRGRGLWIGIELAVRHVLTARLSRSKESCARKRMTG